MSKTTFLSEDAWVTISDLAEKAKSRRVAVAYIGADALDMLPLGKGDTLIVDLSHGPVKSGSTNPFSWAIRGFVRSTGCSRRIRSPASSRD